jgi:hypothetical protein
VGVEYFEEGALGRDGEEGEKRAGEREGQGEGEREIGVLDHGGATCQGGQHQPHHLFILSLSYPFPSSRMMITVGSNSSLPLPIPRTRIKRLRAAFVGTSTGLLRAYGGTFTRFSFLVLIMFGWGIGLLYRTIPEPGWVCVYLGGGSVLVSSGFLISLSLPSRLFPLFLSFFYSCFFFGDDANAIPPYQVQEQNDIMPRRCLYRGRYESVSSNNELIFIR